MPSPPRSRLISLLLAAIAALVCGAAPARAADTSVPARAAAPGHVPGQVVVRTRDPQTGAVKAGRHVIRDGESIRETVRELERRPDVVSATPNYIARISQHIPNDPGRRGVPGGWQELQWNFLAEAGVNAPGAWDNLLRAGRPGGRGVVVAVLDTGVAYRDLGRFRRSPDLSSSRFVRGYDFVDRDAHPLDHNGHGTHVASTIGESAGNGQWLTGIAYGARIMPVRVLDRLGEGDSVAIASGIRFAARRGAKVINLSFEFGTGVSAGEIPDILSALRYARRRGALVVGASGNGGAASIAYPARADQVLSVGATTEHRCQADYSNTGRGLDIVAPGGGADADLPAEADRCRPDEPQGRDIYQTTFLGGNPRRFGMPAGYVGTSMAAPHVSAVAALVVASRVIGANPKPSALERHLEATAVDLGPSGRDPRYGAGLIDAARATTPAAR